MHTIQPIRSILDHRGTRRDLEAVVGVLWPQQGMINYKGEHFSPKVTPDLFYMSHFTYN